MSITSSIAKINSQLQSIQKAIGDIDKKIEQEKKLYHEDFFLLETKLYKQVEVDNINVPLLTYQPNLEQITTQNITSTIQEIDEL